MGDRVAKIITPLKKTKGIQSTSMKNMKAVDWVNMNLLIEMLNH